MIQTPERRPATNHSLLQSTQPLELHTVHLRWAWHIEICLAVAPREHDSCMREWIEMKEKAHCILLQAEGDDNRAHRRPADARDRVGPARSGDAAHLGAGALQRTVLSGMMRGVNRFPLKFRVRDTLLYTVPTPHSSRTKQRNCYCHWDSRHSLNGSTTKSGEPCANLLWLPSSFWWQLSLYTQAMPSRAETCTVGHDLMQTFCRPMQQSHINNNAEVPFIPLPV